MCQNFGTRCHTCAKSCAKSAQIWQYPKQIIANGNKRNKVCNYLNFSLFPLDFVDFSTFLSTNIYLPMQKVSFFPRWCVGKLSISDYQWLIIVICRNCDRIVDFCDKHCDEKASISYCLISRHSLSRAKEKNNSFIRLLGRCQDYVTCFTAK